MILPILKFPDKRLARKSEEIAEITPEVRKLAEDMVETMYARNGIGLAAPQVGALLRLIVVDVTEEDQESNLHILINPKLSVSGPEIAFEEACLSVPDYTGVVYRLSKVRCEALNLEGEKVIVEADGLFGICLQHECDHLDGKLFIDHISPLKRMIYTKKMTKLQKK